MALATTNYLPVVYFPDDSEKYRLLEHHRKFGTCAASVYCAARNAGYRIAEHPQPLRNLQVKKSKPVYFWRRLSFIGFLLGRLSAC